MKQIQRTSSLLNFFTYLFNLSQMISSSIYFIMVEFVLCISFIHLFLLLFCLFAAERIISLEKKETYNIYLVLERNVLRENIELRLWHGCVCLIKLRICPCHLQLWSQGFGKEGCCHITVLSVYESSVTKVCN